MGNVPQMLLGTLPVIFICTPCVLAGACLSRVTGGESDPWVGKSRLAILMSTAGQGGAFVLALLFVFQTIAKNREELARPRPEHKVIEELTKQEEIYCARYMRVTDWSYMQLPYKTVIVLAVYGQLISTFALTMLDQYCFRPFYISSSIGDPYDAYPPGLEGKPLSIIRIAAVPFIVIFLIATTLHILHCKSAENRSKLLTTE